MMELACHKGLIFTAIIKKKIFYAKLKGSSDARFTQVDMIIWVYNILLVKISQCKKTLLPCQNRPFLERAVLLHLPLNANELC